MQELLHQFLKNLVERCLTEESVRVW